MMSMKLNYGLINSLKDFILTSYEDISVRNDYFNSCDINGNWKIYEHAESGESLLNASCFINNSTNCLVIAFAGSSVKIISQGVKDLTADLHIAGQRMPDKKIQDIKKFLERLQERIDLKDYDITVTGHSLGGVLSDLAAACLLELGIKVKDSITFENPGSKPILKNAIADGYFSGNTHSRIFGNKKLLKLNPECKFISIQSPYSNIVNTMNEQVGEALAVINSNKSRESCSPEEQTKNEINKESSSFLSQIKDVCSSTIHLFGDLKNNSTFGALFNSMPALASKAYNTSCFSKFAAAFHLFNNVKAHHALKSIADISDNGSNLLKIKRSDSTKDLNLSTTVNLSIKQFSRVHKILKKMKKHDSSYVINESYDIVRKKIEKNNITNNSVTVKNKFGQVCKYVPLEMLEMIFSNKNNIEIIEHMQAITPKKMLYAAVLNSAYNINSSAETTYNYICETTKSVSNMMSDISDYMHSSAQKIFDSCSYASSFLTNSDICTAEAIDSINNVEFCKEQSKKIINDSDEIALS